MWILWLTRVVLLQISVKEKAEILVQVEKLTKVKDELTSEVDKLSIQLQQERSKVSALMDAKKTAVKFTLCSYYLYFCVWLICFFLLSDQVHKKA